MYGELNKTIGERMREIRQRVGISQAELARRMYCSKSKVSQCEAGKRGVTFEYVEDFARVIGISPFEILRFPDIPENIAIIEEHDGREMLVIPEVFVKILSLRDGSSVELIPKDGGLFLKPVK